jgi:cytochrome c oxidase subunit IV
MTHSNHNPGGSHDEVLHHPDHFWIYMRVFAALIVLTSCSLFAYSPLWPFQETPWIRIAFMFTVSCIKAFLVISFFMHLRWEANWKYVLTIPTSIMAIFLMIMLTPDIGFRVLRFAEERLQYDAEATHAHPHNEAHGPASHGGGHARDGAKSGAGEAHGAETDAQKH